MSGPSHIPVTGSEHRPRPHPLDDPRLRAPGGRFPPMEVHLMEDRIVVQSHEIQALLLDNQRLAASHVALKQDVAAAQQDLRRLSMTASTVKAERDAQVREVYERSLKLEAEARSVEGLSAELDRVRVDIKEVRAESKELSEKLESIDGDIARIKSESQQLLDLKAEIETMHREIQRGRAAVEYERKMHSHNFELSEAMEKHMISMAHEEEKLRSKLANAEQRVMVAANPGSAYAMTQINLEPGYGGNPLSDPYTVHQGTFDACSNYAIGGGPHGPSNLYDVQN